MSGEHREWQWFHQCLSLAVVKGNAVSILACVKFNLTLSPVY